MESWNGLFAPDEVLKALEEDGFTSPTRIQALCLPSAIRDRKDIIGAAETGSGKTLAFAIPLLHHILEDKANQTMHMEQDKALDIAEDSNNADGIPTEIGEIVDLGAVGVDIGVFEDSDDEDHNLPPDDSECEDIKDNQFGCVKVLHLDAFEWEKKLKKKKPSAPLYALVLTPTRELALQIKQHIDKAARHTDIKTALVVGGMSTQKQERMLGKCPEIVVATPGRLWELYSEGNPHLLQMSSIKYLVIDEGDRMVEKGHFAELTKILGHINGNNALKGKRQTFVFSATLTFIHSGPDRFVKNKKSKFKPLTEKEKLDELIDVIGLRTKPKVIDLTEKKLTAEKLVESRITCPTDEKDLHMYYFILKHPGRTLVFCNSKDCVRRLVSIFTLLQQSPLSLHADMPQRQRLKHLDKFKDRSMSLLIATDVAARGLDIPNVEHVIHYQVPRTSENYVHRSGRTARASKEGITVLLVAPEDLDKYRKILKNINQGEDLPAFPVDNDTVSALRPRMNLALNIDKEQIRFTKKSKENNWFQKMAEEMDIELDEDELLHPVADDHEQKMQNQKLAVWKKQLKTLLSQPVIKTRLTSKYPTQQGRLIIPYLDNSSSQSAVDELKNSIKAQTDGDKKSKEKRKRRRGKKGRSTSSGSVTETNVLYSAKKSEVKGKKADGTTAKDDQKNQKHKTTTSKDTKDTIKSKSATRKRKFTEGKISDSNQKKIKLLKQGKILSGKIEITDL